MKRLRVAPRSIASAVHLHVPPPLPVSSRRSLTSPQTLRQREHPVHPGENWRAQHRNAQVIRFPLEDAAAPVLLHLSQALSDQFCHQRPHDAARRPHSGYCPFAIPHNRARGRQMHLWPTPVEEPLVTVLRRKQSPHGGKLVQSPRPCSATGSVLRYYILLLPHILAVKAVSSDVGVGVPSTKGSL